MEKLQPKLRFPEFKGDWKKNKLSEIAFKKTNKNKDSLIKNVFTNSANFGIVNQKDFFDRDIANQNNIDGYYIVENNDFVYNPRISSSAPVGPISRNNLETGIMSPLYYVFSFNKGNLDYLDYFFSTKVWHKHMENIANYGARSDRMSFSINDFYLMPISFPILEEQTKIANFLSAVDKKINQLTEKKNLLEDYKKGIMQKIFNQEIRFKDDNGKHFPEWSVTKLSDFKNLIHGDGDWILSKDMAIDGEYHVIQLGNIGLGYYVEKKLKTINKDTFEEIKGTLIEKGDLLINRMVDDNLYTCIFNEEGNYITSVDVCWIRENGFLNNYFLMSLILHKPNQNLLLNLSSGSGRVRISKSNLFNEFSFSMPCLEEQNKIANFLSAIDDKINQVNTQLESTKEFKKGLLQQMFI